MIVAPDDLPSVAIVGGGLAGLSAAWHLKARAKHISVVLMEKEGRLGGRACTPFAWKVDHGAHYFLKSEASLWGLIREMGFPRAVRLIDEQNAAFDGSWVDSTEFGEASKVPFGYSTSLQAVRKLFRGLPDTVRRLRRVLGPKGSLRRSVSTQMFDVWLREALDDDSDAQEFVRLLLLGDICAPHGHVTTTIGKGCLDSLVRESERWYCLRGGMGQLVRDLSKRLRESGVRILKGCETREIRRARRRFRITGLRRGRSFHGLFDAVIMAAPLDGSLTILGQRPRREYHAYISVLLKMQSSPDRVFSRIVKGGLTTGRTVYFVTRQGSGIYRMLIPDARQLCEWSDSAIRNRCREDLVALAQLPRSALNGSRWSVKRWRVGLPCSLPLERPDTVPGLVYAGDWTAQFPSMDGAVKSGKVAAKEVTEYVRANHTNSSLLPENRGNRTVFGALESAETTFN